MCFLDLDRLNLAMVVWFGWPRCPKMLLTLKVVRSDTKIIIFLLLPRFTLNPWNFQYNTIFISVCKWPGILQHGESWFETEMVCLACKSIFRLPLLNCFRSNVLIPWNQSYKTKLVLKMKNLSMPYYCKSFVLLILFPKLV